MSIDSNAAVTGFKRGDMVRFRTPGHRVDGREGLVTFVSDDELSVWTDDGEYGVKLFGARDLLERIDHGSDPVRVTCYGKTTVWPSRKAAMLFFREGMRNSEGCERERYESIWFDLHDGLSEVSD